MNKNLPVKKLYAINLKIFNNSKIRPRLYIKHIIYYTHRLKLFLIDNRILNNQIPVKRKVIMIYEYKIDISEFLRN